METAPVLAAVFPPLHDTNVVWTERGTYLYGFAYQWLGEKEIKTRFLPDYKRFNRDIHSDKFLCKDLHSILGRCDMAIGHNAQSFDIRIIRSRLIIHDFDPLPPIKVSDTLKWARSIGRFDSNRLNALGEATGIGQKIPTKNDLWRRCYHGDLKAFESMRRYCAMDVTLLARWYERISPWAPDHIPMVSGSMNCAACQSSHLNRRGSAVSRKRRYWRLQCVDCGHWQQGEIIREPVAG